MRDITTKSNGDDYLPAEFNGFYEDVKNTILSMGIGLSNGDLFQLAQTMAHYSSSGNYYIDTGAADAYVVDEQGLQRPIKSLINGSLVVFIPTNANTGASTINVAGLGVKSLDDYDGTAIASGRLAVGQPVACRYFVASDEFRIDLPAATTIRLGLSREATPTEVENDTGGGFVTPPNLATKLAGTKNLKTIIKTSGTGTISIPLGANNVRALLVAGAGGGGGVPTVSAANGALGGIDGGIIDVALTNAGGIDLDFSIGSGGTGGADGSNPGTDGGDTTLGETVPSVVDLTAAGGKGGDFGGAAPATPATATANTISGTGVIANNFLDIPGRDQRAISGVDGGDGEGGYQGKGAGRGGVSGSVNGEDAYGYGAGGGGALDDASGNNGGDGSGGFIMVQYTE